MLVVRVKSKRLSEMACGFFFVSLAQGDGSQVRMRLGVSRVDAKGFVEMLPRLIVFLLAQIHRAQIAVGLGGIGLDADRFAEMLGPLIELARFGQCAAQALRRPG